jgi:hypothetical protein
VRKHSSGSDSGLTPGRVRGPETNKNPVRPRTFKSAPRTPPAPAALHRLTLEGATHDTAKPGTRHTIPDTRHTNSDTPGHTGPTHDTAKRTHVTRKPTRKQARATKTTRKEGYPCLKPRLSQVRPMKPGNRHLRQSQYCPTLALHPVLPDRVGLRFTGFAFDVFPGHRRLCRTGKRI